MYFCKLKYKGVEIKKICSQINITVAVLGLLVCKYICHLET
nr:hypothetical protein B11C_110594 [Bartonella sp. 1-1C]